MFICSLSSFGNSAYSMEYPRISPFGDSGYSHDNLTAVELRTETVRFCGGDEPIIIVILHVRVGHYVF